MDANPPIENLRNTIAFAVFPPGPFTSSRMVGISKLGSLELGKADISPGRDREIGIIDVGRVLNKVLGEAEGAEAK